MKDAAAALRRAVSPPEPVLPRIGASLDGWRSQRGFCAAYGYGTAVSVPSGKVLDHHVASAVSVQSGKVLHYHVASAVSVQSGKVFHYHAASAVSVRSGKVLDYHVASAVSVQSGKVLDCHVASKVCPECAVWDRKDPEHTSDRWK